MRLLKEARHLRVAVLESDLRFKISIPFIFISGLITPPLMFLIFSGFMTGAKQKMDGLRNWMAVRCCGCVKDVSIDMSFVNN